MRYDGREDWACRCTTSPAEFFMPGGIASQLAGLGCAEYEKTWNITSLSICDAPRALDAEHGTRVSRVLWN